MFASVARFMTLGLDFLSYLLVRFAPLYHVSTLKKPQFSATAPFFSSPFLMEKKQAMGGFYREERKK